MADGNGTALATLSTEQREGLFAALSTSLDRLKFARRAGFQYDGERDVYRTAGYPPEGSVEFEHLYGRYRRQDVAGQVVDMFPGTTWRNPPVVVEPDMDKDKPTPFVEEVAGLVRRLRLWHRMERADRLARIGRYGIILIGTGDVEDDKGLAEPMAQLTGPDDLLYLQPYHEGAAVVDTWVTNPSDERFGLPELYMVDPQGEDDTFPISAFRVHWSRVVHVAEDRLSSDVYGQPVLERVLNRLMDLEKVCAATGESYWQLAANILVGSVDPDTQIDDATFDAMGEAMEEIMHDLRRQFLGKGLSLDWLGSTPPDPGPAADLCMTLVAAASGYPKRVLYGSETGERASTEDQKQYMGSVKERQETFAEPTMIRPLLDTLIEHGGLTPPVSGEYEVEWPNLFEVPEKDEADVDRIRAEAAKALTPVGGDPSALVVIDDEGRIRLKALAETEKIGDELDVPDNRDIQGPPEAQEGPPNGDAVE